MFLILATVDKSWLIKLMKEECQNMKEVKLFICILIVFHSIFNRLWCDMELRHGYWEKWMREGWKLLRSGRREEWKNKMDGQSKK